jgi:protein-S-isoprenylcysteine O-methyltransferase Ste14
MRRRVGVLGLTFALALAAPAAAFAHDAPENEASRWTMADWMIDTFFVFAGIAFIAFLWTWKAGHFHNLEEAARVPLGIDEGDYYTPAWALDEEEWRDADR